MLGRSVWLTGAFTEGKWTSILFSRLVDGCCGGSAGVGVVSLVVKGVVYPLPEEVVSDVGALDASEVSVDRVRRPAGRFTGATASSAGNLDEAGGVGVSTMGSDGRIQCSQLRLTLRCSDAGENL